MLTMTHHARTRIQQRGIPEVVVEDLLDFGREAYDHHGRYVVYFDRRARKELRRACGDETYKRIEGRLDAYAVVAGSGDIITVGHRTRRIHRH
jgi:hypothetical protein